MATYTTLIGADALHQLMVTTCPVVLDCRFSLIDTAIGESRYRSSHIPGAYYTHLDRDLSSPIISGRSGRHPLPDATGFIHHLQTCGVHNHSQVVLYDDAAGAFAARAWWLCRWIGLETCAVLNGGYRAWNAQQLPVSPRIPVPGSGSVEKRTSLANAIDVSEVPSDKRLLVDARDPERYTGEHEPLDPVGGHIPGAINLPFAGNLGPDQKFLDRDALHTRFAPLVQQAGANADSAITHYCGSGVTAAHNVLAMLYAGYPATDLYAGSWSEWVQDPSRPVATGVG